MVFQLQNINTTKGISMTNFVTPKGIAVWPKLNAPDYKFNVDGEYKTTLKIEASKSQDLIKQLEGLRDAYRDEEAKSNPKVAKYDLAPVYEEEEDDQGNLTGFNLFKFKQKAKITTRRGDMEMKVALYDSNKTPTDATVTGGSTIRVAASAYTYAMPSTRRVGVSLRPSAIQIIQLAQGSGGAEALSMFDKEDGFVADNFDNSSEAVAVSDDADF
jgi:hypothetical protein